MTLFTTPGEDSIGGNGTLTATDLRCRHLTDPLGIDSARPVFSWVPTGKANTVRGFRILVAGDPDLLRRGIGDRWDSGKVESRDTSGVRYAGEALRSRERYWWTVRLWDDEGLPGAYAPAATFEMGLLDPSDWQAAWIAAEDPDTSSPQLRTEFDVSGVILRARAYVAALGYYELRLNGERVGDRVLDPATTTYDHDPELHDSEGNRVRIASPRILYSTYDITDRIRRGANAVGVTLGHGWYSAEEDIGPGPMPRTPYGDRPRALVQLELELADGGRQTIVSDADWKVHPGPITYNDYAHGEHYDARAETLGWDGPGFDAVGWGAAQVAERAPAGALRSQPLEPIRIIDTREPATTTTTRSEKTLVDFGQHISGWTRITVRGPEGAQVVLRHAGEVDLDGELDTDANEDAWLPARQRDEYILRGAESGETWEPRFTLHGFRYVELTVPDDVRLDTVVARVVHSDLEPVGDFACSDPMLERIHHNVLWTFRASFQGFPQDAADRGERVGWVGDPGWSVEDYLYNYNSLSFWSKWLDDLADAQLADGRFPVICPIHWRGRVATETTEGHEDVPEDVSFGYWPYALLNDFAMTSYPSIAWHLYQFYGDRSILEDHYEGMRRGLDFLRARAKGHIMTEGLGDHMEPQADGTCSVSPKRTPIELTSTAWYYAVTRMVADAAEVIGNTADATRYRELADCIRNAFNAEFFDESTGQYATGSQTALAMPLWLGLVPDEHRQLVGERLVQRIVESDNGHLATGTMGTAALQNVLADIGAADVMYDIATRPTFPSWAQQVLAGATTVWETWGGDPGFSRNMKLLAMIEKFLYNDVAGLAPAGPGWQSLLVQPKLTHRLQYARARVGTPRGEAAVEWTATAGDLDLRIRVPATSDAQIRFPVTGPEPVLISGDHVVWPAGEDPPSPHPIELCEGYLVVSVRGGDHRFRLLFAPARRVAGAAK
ncbi:family 78 glycoside hydrolase catalytic domain [Nocardia brevicatena]|uniref:family 78 glycoside hydrolase catalytic domain n=1 Tax=Nocardia brevicatena TaxID=37327 RepID=UPI0002FC5A82|nr:family 78 glycoside hydrolase catalytic domain [Nocardia brevicatena]